MQNVIDTHVPARRSPCPATGKSRARFTVVIIRDKLFQDDDKTNILITNRSGTGQRVYRSENGKTHTLQRKENPGRHGQVHEYRYSPRKRYGEANFHVFFSYTRPSSTT